MNRPLRVHVCIDQERRDVDRSGLARSWMRFLEEAARCPDLEVTAHWVGERPQREEIAERVRCLEHPLVLGSTAWLERLGFRTPARVGLFPFHPAVARELARADVIHTTYTHLSFAMTALAVASLRGIPLVNSLQTHVPLHSAIYAQRLAERLFGRGPLRGPLVEAHGFAAPLQRAFEAQERFYLGRCNRVLLSDPADISKLPGPFPRERVHHLGRGIERELFHPGRRDRAWLEREFGVPRDLPVVLFVGRLMPEKDVLTLARALARLERAGERFAALFCGEGDEAPRVRALLGQQAILAGLVPHERLARIYASADLFAFPSTTEMYANVVVEAMSCGLPVVVSGRGGSRQHVSRPGENGILVESRSPQAWARAIGALLRDPQRRARIGRAARERIEKVYLDWAQVFAGELLPVWRAAAREGPRPGRRPRARLQITRRPGRRH